MEQHNSRLEELVSRMQDARWVVDEALKTEVDIAVLPTEQMLAAVLLRTQMIALVFVQIQQAASGPLCLDCAQLQRCTNCESMLGALIRPAPDSIPERLDMLSLTEKLRALNTALLEHLQLQTSNQNMLISLIKELIKPSMGQEANAQSRELNSEQP